MESQFPFLSSPLLFYFARAHPPRTNPKTWFARQNAFFLYGFSTTVYNNIVTTHTSFFHHVQVYYRRCSCCFCCCFCSCTQVRYDVFFSSKILNRGIDLTATAGCILYCPHGRVLARTCYPLVVSSESTTHPE